MASASMARRGGGVTERDGVVASPDRDRGHAGQGLRRDRRLHRRLGGDGATSCAPSPRASSSRPRCRRRRGRRRAQPSDHLQRQQRRTRPAARTRGNAAPAARCGRRAAPAQCQPHRARDGARPRGLQARSATCCSTSTASMCSRSTTRPCRAAPSGCASRRHRCIATPTWTSWWPRWRMSGRASASGARPDHGRGRQPRQRADGRRRNEGDAPRQVGASPACRAARDPLALPLRGPGGAGGDGAGAAARGH